MGPFIHHIIKWVPKTLSIISALRVWIEKKILCVLVLISAREVRKCVTLWMDAAGGEGENFRWKMSVVPEHISSTETLGNTHCPAQNSLLFPIYWYPSHPEKHKAWNSTQLQMKECKRKKCWNKRQQQLEPHRAAAPTRTETWVHLSFAVPHSNTLYFRRAFE